MASYSAFTHENDSYEENISAGTGSGDVGDDVVKKLNGKIEELKEKKNEYEGLQPLIFFNARW